MNFCSHCGHPVSLKIPQGDNRLRHVCAHCDSIHYQNPKIVAGCLPLWQQRVLLCRRSIEPRYGFWTLPAGFMENGETTLQAALRECLEEACADITEPRLYGVYNLPRSDQIYVMFRGQLRTAKSFGVGIESLETRLFSEAEIPWDEIAFKVMTQALRRFFEERKTGAYSIVNEDVA